MGIFDKLFGTPECIKAVAENCPDVLVGAGTIVNLEQCKLAVEMGAKFIVSPGFSDEVVGWCVEHGIAVAPGCVTPTEIMGALKHGLFHFACFRGHYLYNMQLSFFLKKT